MFRFLNRNPRYSQGDARHTPPSLMLLTVKQYTPNKLTKLTDCDTIHFKSTLSCCKKIASKNQRLRRIESFVLDKFLENYNLITRTSTNTP
jgi:hypothetical protein